ncbi:hypothetical protein [Bacillus thuringiensis]|uniref:hypothetical protein n=1 Tax=Bacillus thuringiensis TaxID=1428 RepID=UPI000BFDE1C6|nr:hypothetical protein [Bacillus thuringiensis]PGT90114.1 hypothetical protein COD17_10210 [Bacillus thuringiensis]
MLYEEPTTAIRLAVLSEVHRQLGFEDGQSVRIITCMDGLKRDTGVAVGSESSCVQGKEKETMQTRIRNFHMLDGGLFASQVVTKDSGLMQAVSVFAKNGDVSDYLQASWDTQVEYRNIYLNEILSAFDMYVYTDAEGIERYVPLTETSHFTGRDIAKEGAEALLRLKEQGKRVLYLDTSMERKVKVLTQYTHLVQDSGKILYMGRYLPMRMSHPRLEEINPFLDDELMDTGFQYLGKDKETHLVYRASMVDKWFDKAIDTLKDRNHGVLAVSMETDNLLQDMGLKYLVAKHKGFDWKGEAYHSDQLESIVYPAVNVVLYNVNDMWLEVNIEDWV